MAKTKTKKSKKRYSILETLSIAQIAKKQISPVLLKVLKEQSSFKDTDKQLGEFIVSVSTILDIADEADTSDNIELMDLAEELYREMTGFQYVMVTTV